MMATRVPHLWRRFRALDRGDGRLVVEAVLLIGIVQVGMRTLRFARLLRVLASAKRLRSGSHHSHTRIGWAVRAAARLAPGRTCLSVALVADVMLSRRGYRPRLRIGVKKTRGGAVPLEGHAWVECDGSIVAGDLAALDDYRRFAIRVSAPTPDV